MGRLEPASAGRTVAAPCAEPNSAPAPGEDSVSLTSNQGKLLPRLETPPPPGTQRAGVLNPDFPPQGTWKPSPARSTLNSRRSEFSRRRETPPEAPGPPLAYPAASVGCTPPQCSPRPSKMSHTHVTPPSRGGPARAAGHRPRVGVGTCPEHGWREDSGTAVTPGASAADRTQCQPLSQLPRNVQEGKAPAFQSLPENTAKSLFWPLVPAPPTTHRF